MIQKLLPHPTSSHSAELWHIQSRLQSNEKGLELFYQIKGDSSRLAIPEPHGEARRLDHLWQETCCELFLRRQNESTDYLEFNFAPSGHWAFYRLSGYRATLERPEIGDSPVIKTHIEVGETSVEAKIPWSMIKHHLQGSSPLEVGLSVILKEKSGTITYWAVKHPSDKPDFHHPDSFFNLAHDQNPLDP